MYIEDSRTRVKICGITTLEDGRFASGALADFLGFIFWPGSPRFITAEAAAEIIGWTEGPECVGVFVDQPLEEVNRMAEETGVDLVQLHGDESVEYCRQVTKPVIKSFRVKPAMTEVDIANMINPYLNHIAYILFDSFDKDVQGGSGKTFDWTQIEKLKEQVPVILAGGLNAQNIAHAIETVKPFAVDVSSGVELEPGIKDFEKMTAFFEQINNINEEW
ncbi:MAG: phosphoribosylanthranilate isomerase [Balneolales bacterium]